MIVYDEIGFSNSFSVINSYFKLSRSVVDRKKYENIYGITESLIENLTKLLDRPSNNISVSDIENFLQYSSTFRDKLFELVSLIENKSITPKQKDKFFEVYKNEEDRFNLANLDWLEPIRKIKNRFSHDSQKPEVKQSYFNYFQLLENKKTEFPYIQFYNDKNNLVYFDHYLSHIIFCFSYLLRLMARKLEVKSNNNIISDIFPHNQYCDMINELNNIFCSKEEKEKRNLFSKLDLNK
ncbi:hypothetical protein, partial [Photobacterium carnosum]